MRREMKGRRYILWFLSAFSLLLQAQNLRAEEVQQKLMEMLPAVLKMIEDRKAITDRSIKSVTDNVPDYNAQPVSFPNNTPQSSEIEQKSDSRIFVQSGNYKPFRGGLRDPFTVTPEIQFSSLYGNNSRFSSLQYTGSLPKLTLKGITYKDDPKNSLALLEVTGNGVHMVRVGDEIGINPADPKEVIKIRKIDRLSLIIEFGTLGDIIIVR